MKENGKRENFTSGNAFIFNQMLLAKEDAFQPLKRNSLKGRCKIGRLLVGDLNAEPALGYLWISKTAFELQSS